MSRFFSATHGRLVPYTPGEQPRDQQYVKLNTNESPFAPSPKAQAYAAQAASQLQLYPDPTYRELTERVAELCGVSADEVLLTNGSDEILNFAFMAFCDADHPAVFPNITYGFYKVFADCNHVPYTEIPLDSEFRIRVEEYIGIHKPIFLANPNAPTGLVLSVAEIERIVKSNPDTVVVVDEAYVDFGAESCIPLIHQYDNLLVTQTFSKSRSMAGARLGFGVGNAALIRDLNTIKYAVNPYNVNRMTAAAGLGVLQDETYTKQNCETIIRNRETAANALREMGFAVTDSAANFLFAKHPAVDGKYLYEQLKKNGVLVRHFDTPLLTDYNRITVGTQDQMQILLDQIQRIIGENTR